MTWARLDDRAWHNQKLLALTPGARLLWVFGLSFIGAGWPENGGAIAQASASMLARTQGVPTRAIAELVEAGRWERGEGGAFVVHDVAAYFPPSDLIVKRREAGRRGGRVSRSNPEANAPDLLKPLPSGARVESRPVNPVTTTTTPNGSVVVAAAADDAAAFADLLEPVRVDLVGVYVDACRAAGAEPVARMPARVGAAAKELRDAGHRDEVLAIAVRELARRNEQPARLAWIVGDVERHQAGTPIGRIRPPALTAPSENPVDVRVRAEKARLAEMRAEEARSAEQR